MNRGNHLVLFMSKQMPLVTRNTITCPVTFEEYTEVNFPVSLPCGHTISSVAAKSIFRGSSVFADPGRLDLLGCRKFRCPTCRGETVVKPDHKFPKNYAILDLVSDGQCDATTPNAPPAAPVAAATAPVTATPAAARAIELYNSYPRVVM